MERISTNYGTKLVSLFITLFFSLSVVVSAQNDCMGTQSVVVNPPPAGGGYAPGTVVEYCVTYNNWNTGIGTNWLEGFDLTIGGGWDLATLTPTTFPPNQGGNGSGGQWIWEPGTFNGNPASSGWRNRGPPGRRRSPRCASPHLLLLDTLGFKDWRSNRIARLRGAGLMF
jgi:hypothetical protein